MHIFLISGYIFVLGEILVIEKAFAWALDASCLHTNCSFCFTKCDALIPCNGCTEVLFIQTPIR